MRELIAIFALAACAGCGVRSAAHGRRAIVIGVDGMDPEFVQRHWRELPNLASLGRAGSFAKLKTTTPPQSPVAWSTFITGLDPSGHGIFDFVHRDPRTMEPFLSMDRTLPARFTIPLGPYELPLSGARVESLRKGTAFWQLLEDAGIPATIVRMPANYPPVEAGEAIAGMGTPDLRGTQGTFAFYTGEPGAVVGEVAGGRIVAAEVAANHAELNIEGPPNSLRKDRRHAAVTMSVDIDPEQPLARLAVGNQMAIVREREWSEWIPVDFPLMPHVASVHGMIRVYARELRPRFEVYVTPVNADPLSPDLRISAPRGFSREMAGKVGRFSTLGIPEDTSVLRQGVFSLTDFLSESRLIAKEERSLFLASLDRFQEGLLFFYFSSVDQNSHILWGKYDGRLMEFYRMVDDSIGEALRRAPGAEVMVMSDHGFAPFHRSVNLNNWLAEKGLLAVKAGTDQIDWTRTKVYAMGLNALYVNLKGRERFGVVTPGEERDRLIAEVREQLLALRDPANGAVVVKTVSGTNAAEPDLIAGYARDYRAAWQAGVGGLSPATFEDNDGAWIADHCINAEDVPGVLFSRRKLRVTDPALKDLPVSLLGLFGVAAGTGMTGRSVY